MIRNQKELKAALYKEMKSIKEIEIFTSKAYEDWLTQMQHGICKKNIRSFTFNGGNDGEIAFTDSSSVKINVTSIMTKELNTEEKHKLFCGLNLHEAGHVLFSDFSLTNEVLNKLKSGIIYPKLHSSTPYLDELEDYLAKEGGGRLTSLFMGVMNSIEDGFVDRMVCKAVPGYSGCLRFAQKVDKKEFISYEEMKTKKMEDEKIFLFMTLAYARHGERLYEECHKQDELVASFIECEEWINKAVFENSPMLRSKYVWCVFCTLFHFIKIKDQEKQQNNSGNSQNQSNSSGGSQNQSNNSGGSQNQSNSSGGSQNQSNSSGGSQNQSNSSGGSQNQRISEMAESLGNQIEKDTISHDTTKGPLATNEEMKQISQGNGDIQETNRNSGDGGLEELKKKAAMAKVAEKQEKELTSEMKVNLSQQKKGMHSKVSANISRLNPIGSMPEDVASLDAITRRFIRSFEEELKERQIGDSLTGLNFGTGITINEVYRNDKKIFNRKIDPEAEPDMAIGILVDLSGSMSGNKVDVARQCAYITYKFCKHFNIPVFVIGHNTDCGVSLVSAVDEKSLDNMDAQRIFAMKSGGCNRDGYALRYCLDKLRKIPAEDKLMMIISDGCPNDDNYGREEGRIDCQDAVMAALKDGIHTICAGIDDAESVRYIYKHGISEKKSAEYLELTDLTKVPKAFIKIIKKHMM